MVLFDLTVEKQVIHGADKIALAASANKTIGLRFHFDRHWRDFSSRAAIFRTYSGEFYIIEIINNIAVIPWEVLKDDNDIELSVIAYSSSAVLTSGAVSLAVSRSLLPEEYAAKSASETLFDKFKRECTAQAFLDYEDELNEQKSAYENALLQKQNEITAERQNTVNAVAQKDVEIAALNLQHAEEKTSLQTQLTNTQTQLAAMTVKADKWDMIDNAISKKTASNQPLWGNGTEPYSLPDLNTSSMSSFSGASFGSNLEEIGLDLSATTAFNGVLQNKTNLKKVRLNNTNSITNLACSFQECSSIENILIGDIPNCTNMYKFAYNCVFLKKITIGENRNLQVMESAFTNCFVLEEIDTVLDVAICSTFADAFVNCTSLKEIRFKPNTISAGISLASSLSLTKESIISVVNGLNPDVSSKTLSLNKYSFFQAFPDEDEREEICDLITDTKGWILRI